MNLKAKKVQVKNQLLLPRSGHKLVVDDKYLYLIGGYVERKIEGMSPVDSNEVRGEIWRLHFLCKTWEKCNFDKEIFNLGASHSAIKNGDCIFITGGTGLPFGLNILDHVIVIDVKNMTQNKYHFRPKDNQCKNLPIATYGHTVTYAIVDRKPCLYLIGGTTGTTYHQEVYKIDLISLESSLVSDSNTRNSPKPRYKHECFLFGDEIYMLGGTTQNNISFSLDEIHVFNIHTYEWTQKTAQNQIKINLRCPSMCQNGQYIYVTGGQGPDGSISKSIYQFDIVSLTWSIIAQWDRPCYFHDSVFAPQFGSVFMFGGLCNFIPAERTNELYQFQPLTGRAAPSLTDLAWKSLIYTVLQTKNACDDCSINDAVSLSQELLKMGLPGSIVKRITIHDHRVSNTS